MAKTTCVARTATEATERDSNLTGAADPAGDAAIRPVVAIRAARE